MDRFVSAAFPGQATNMQARRALAVTCLPLLAGGCSAEPVRSAAAPSLAFASTTPSVTATPSLASQAPPASSPSAASSTASKPAVSTWKADADRIGVSARKQPRALPYPKNDADLVRYIGTVATISTRAADALDDVAGSPSLLDRYVRTLRKQVEVNRQG